MKIVDAQVHIWDSGTPVSIHRQVSRYTAEELLKEMDEAGVDAAVLHPPSWDPRANEVSIDAAKRYPDRLSVLGFFDAADPASRQAIETWKQQPGMLGLRFAFLKPGTERWLFDGTLDWVWPAAERLGLPVGILVSNQSGMLPVIGDIAEKHPGLRLLIDHLGRRRHSVDDASFADLDDMLALAKHPNVAIKATGAPSYSTDVYPYRNIHPYIKRIFESFGPRRMFWGTDLTRMPCSYRQCVTMYTEEMPWLKGEDLELVMGRGICEWIGWKI